MSIPPYISLAYVVQWALLQHESNCCAVGQFILSQCYVIEKLSVTGPKKWTLHFRCQFEDNSLRWNELSTHAHVHTFISRHKNHQFPTHTHIPQQPLDWYHTECLSNNPAIQNAVRLFQSPANRFPHEL